MSSLFRSLCFEVCRLLQWDVGVRVALMLRLVPDLICLRCSSHRHHRHHTRCQDHREESHRADCPHGHLPSQEKGLSCLNYIEDLAFFAFHLALKAVTHWLPFLTFLAFAFATSLLCIKVKQLNRLLIKCRERGIQQNIRPMPCETQRVHTSNYLWLSKSACYTASHLILGNILKVSNLSLSLCSARWARVWLVLGTTTSFSNPSKMSSNGARSGRA